VNNGFSYLESAELTDVGSRRKNNEDAMLRLPENGVFCVADGMGGVQGGEVASKATVDALREVFASSSDAPFAVTSASSARLVGRAINRASRWIKARSDERGTAGTGSTVVTLVFDRVTPTQALILHAGDSRAYRYRADRLAQLSADHSVAAAAGLPDDKNLPAMFRGVITRAVGLENSVLLEETPTDVLPGDLFILCSDGLNKMVSDKLLHKLLRKHREDDLQAVAKHLVSEALKAGGEDNVSVVLVRVAAELPSAPTMEVPPETLQLEQEPMSPLPAAHTSAAEEAETGQTVDSAKFAGEGVTPPEMAHGKPQTPQTPVTPATSECVTSSTCATAAPAAAAGPLPPSDSSPRSPLAPYAGGGSDDPSTARPRLWSVLVALLMALGAVAVWFFVSKR
jgi:protein phosphatase